MHKLDAITDFKSHHSLWCLTPAYGVENTTVWSMHQRVCDSLLGPVVPCTITGLAGKFSAVPHLILGQSIPLALTSTWWAKTSASPGISREVQCCSPPNTRPINTPSSSKHLVGQNLHQSRDQQGSSVLFPT